MMHRAGERRNRAGERSEGEMWNVGLGWRDEGCSGRVII